MQMILFPGCKVPYYVPFYETSSRMVLEKFGIELMDMELTCCGYPIRFLDFKAFIFSSARNIALVGERGLPLLCLCKCCYGTLRYADFLLRKNEALLTEVNEILKEEGLQYPPRIEIKHLLNVFFEDIDPTNIWEKNTRPFKELKVAAHYGCHILRPRDVVQFDHPVNPNRFETLVEVTGAISVDWQLRTQCCGEPLWGKNNELSLQLTRKKIANARQAEADVLCVGCTHCQMQFERVREMMRNEDKQNLSLPSILYPQLLGLSLGLDGQALGIDKKVLELIELRNSAPGI
jgi:heterodisulfide reductase subunit B2